MSNSNAARKTVEAPVKATKQRKPTPATTVAAPLATLPQQAPEQSYVLSGPATTLAGQGNQATHTLQAHAKNHGLGKEWRKPGHKAPNTRAIALSAVLAATGGKPFTQEQARLALVAIKDQLGSGTPNSYAKAFVGNGYFQAV
jgi:alkylhydroperoxidase/carboxymuconolactone decarboxylase family protein YurZ